MRLWYNRFAKGVMKEKIVDGLERIVIPKVFRTELGLTEGTLITFHADPETGVLMIRNVLNFNKKAKGFLVFSRN